MAYKEADLFDRLAVRECLYSYTAEEIASVNALVLDKGRVLDMGCGDGVLGAALDADTVIAFDISPRCARLAARKGLKALVADAVAGLPFPAASFDTVYCIDVLHHLGQVWTPVFAELDRVLRPGGAMAIVEPDARNLLVRWTQAPKSPIRVAPYDNEPAIYLAELLPYLERLGYTCECGPFHIHPNQVVRDVFPLWQRLLKAPFVIALALWCRGAPNTFRIVARKPE